MKEIRSIIKAYESIDFHTTKAALATVVRVEGSSYRRTGARMLILDNGNFLGGISGGCLEGDTLRRAQKAIFQNKPSIITYDTTQDDGHQIGVGLGCNGIIDVMITPLDASDQSNPVRLLSAICNTRIPRVLVSIINCNIDSGLLGKAVLYEPGEQSNLSFPVKEIAASLDKDIEQALAEQESKTVEYTTQASNVKVFIEVLKPAIKLVVFGGNYDIYALINVANELGWNVTVVTNKAKAQKSLFAIAEVLDNKGEITPAVDNYTAVMLMSHDYKTDLNNLQKVLLTDASYIGLLGPRKRSKKILHELAGLGIIVDDQDLERIYGPCGLDIGATTPEEIALSIVAEIRAHFAGRQGMSLRLRKGTIYGN
jgi:xanthine/CO dehydrogenase XdhC/CoxF family maturation factor